METCLFMDFDELTSNPFKTSLEEWKHKEQGHPFFTQQLLKLP